MDMKYTVSLTLTVGIDSDGIVDHDEVKAWNEFVKRFKEGTYDADSIDIVEEVE
jgi:hypothetical protein